MFLDWFMLFQEKVWFVLYETITDIEPTDPERLSGVMKPTRLAKFVNWFCYIGH